MIRRHKLLTLFFMGIMLAVAIVPTSTVSAADPETDVHGISFKGSSLIRFAVLPETKIAYPNIDWYIYHHGNVDIFTDGYLTESVNAEGLTIYSQSFEAGTSHIILFKCDSGKSFTFNLDIRKNISLKDIDKDVVYVTLSEDELQMEYLKVGSAVGLLAALAFYIAYRHRRSRNQNEVKDI